MICIINIHIKYSNNYKLIDQWIINKYKINYKITRLLYDDYLINDYDYYAYFQFARLILLHSK